VRFLKNFSITSLLKVTPLVMIAIVSFLVLVVYYGENQWNPIKEIRQLKNQQRRDDAIVLVNFLKDNRICAGDEIDSLDMKVSFGPLKMAKAFILNGTIKGQVSYTYSGIGAMAADFCLFGDI
jgi:hypothetical protein